MHHRWPILRVCLCAVPADLRLYIPLRELLILLGEIPDVSAAQPGHA